MGLLRRIRQKRQGHILLQALIIMPVLYIALFLPFSFAIAQHKRSVLNDTLDMALQRAAVAGGVSEAVRQGILDDLQERGFSPEEVIIEPGGYVPKSRGEMIRITISVPGNAAAFKSVQAIKGETPPEDWMISASGSIMSEKLF